MVRAIKPEFAADDGRLVEVHAGRPMYRNQFDEGATMLGHDDALATRRRGGGLGKAGFHLAYRKFHGLSPKRVDALNTGTPV